MGISIKNPRVEAAIRKLAAQQGVDITKAIELAVNRALENSDIRTRARLRRMRAIADRVAAMPLLDARTDEEILGYDDAGLPT